MPWAGGVDAEPSRKLFMEDVDDIVKAVDTRESRKNRFYFRCVLICRRAARQQTNRIRTIDRASHSLG
jgi:hypothetical protein